MTRLEKELEKTKEKLAKLRLQKREEEKTKKALKPKKKRGRKPLDNELVLKMKHEAFTRPLPMVALKYSVCLQTLYNYGIKRKNLEAEINEKMKAVIKAKNV